MCLSFWKYKTSLYSYYTKNGKHLRHHLYTLTFFCVSNELTLIHFMAKKSFNKNVISRSCTQCMKCNLLNCIFSSVLRLTALDRKTRNPERIRIVALMQTAWTEVIGWRYILFYREKQPAKRLSKDCRLDIWKSSVH